MLHCLRVLQEIQLRQCHKVTCNYPPKELPVQRASVEWMEVCTVFTCIHPYSPPQKKKTQTVIDGNLVTSELQGPLNSMVEDQDPMAFAAGRGVLVRLRGVTGQRGLASPRSSVARKWTTTCKDTSG